MATHGRDYSPSTSVDLEREGVVVVFEVVEVKASKSALGVTSKSTPNLFTSVYQDVHSTMSVSSSATERASPS